MDDLNKLILKNKDLSVIIGVVLISLFITNKLYRGEMAKYEGLKEQIRVEQEKGATLDRIVSLTEKIKKVKVRGWTASDFNSIVDKVFNIAIGTSVKITDITPMEKKDEKNYIIIPFSITGEASYKNLTRFVKKIESYQMVLRVKELSVTPARMPEAGDAAGKEILLKVNMSIEAFYLK